MSEVVEFNGEWLMLFVGGSVFVGGMLAGMPLHFRRIVPQTVLVLVLFLCFGLSMSDWIVGTRLDQLIEALDISPEGIQLVFLPPLIFVEMFKSNSHVFFRVLPQTLLLAFPGVILSCFMTAGFPVYILQTDWSWYTALAFGGMLAATDPVSSM